MRIQKSAARSAVPALIAVTVFLVQLVASGRYGYHGDELYFREAGFHPAFGYVDQPPLTPLIARAMITIFGDSVVSLRLAAALCAAVAVWLTSRIARELGHGSGAQAFAAACAAVSVYFTVVGHQLFTNSFDLVAWTALTWQLSRALRQGGVAWLGAEITAGIGLENKDLILAMLGGFAVGLLVSGPRDVFREKWLWYGVIAMLALWIPNLAWEGIHGWPQLTMATQIGNGGRSLFSVPRWIFLPYQLILFSPFLVPVWLAGWWWLAYSGPDRRYRCLAVACASVVLVLLIVGGKPYYPAGIYPLLLAAGGGPTLAWAKRTRTRIRVPLLVGALTMSTVISLTLALPVVPANDLRRYPMITALNPNSASSLGWEAFARSVTHAYQALPAAERTSTVALTGGYAQAGALDRYRSVFQLPPDYSGNDAYYSWGPPPESAHNALAVGISTTSLHRWFRTVTPVIVFDDGLGVRNPQMARVVMLCQDRQVPWSAIWPKLRTLV